jgi:hypothetical protein
MRDFDLAAAEQKIAEINKAIEGCPDVVKPKAFELLFTQVFGAPASSLGAQEKGKKAPTPGTPPDAPDHIAPEAMKLPGNVQAFLRRNSMSKNVLDKLFMLDQDPMLPIYNIPLGVMAQAQLQKVLMIMLENALLNNQFKAPYAEVRDTCKEDGLFDGNFNKVLKKNSSLFKGAITPDKINEDEQIELTGEGQIRLAEVVRKLAGE